eukprot:INCI8209.1.p1 GENE.INCI8209.1~~INCI8209.1.p1  ORF type:complete len:363 (+),score=52.49 INCI8209.1:265-1353(+)
MSEFEGYQESGETSPSDVQYESMNAQPTSDPEAGSPYATATAEPVEQNDAAKAVGAAESRVAALVKKAGKNGILLGIFVASLVYMIAGGTVCFEGGTLTCVGVSAYAFSAGLISMIVSAVYICLMRFTQMLPDGSIAHRIFAWFFAVWWLGATGTGTFVGPAQFLTTSNGYFAAWGGLFFSLVFLFLVSPIFKAQADKMKAALVNQSFTDQIGLIFSSVVVLIEASATYVADGYSAYAVSTAVISIVFTSVTIFLVTSKDQNPSFVRAFAWITAFLFVWWVVGFCVMTFNQPFPTTGNGYFASIAAVFFSMRLMQATSLWKAMTDKMSGIVGAGGGNATATTEGEPQYASSAAYETEEGMDF